MISYWDIFVPYLCTMHLLTSTYSVTVLCTNVKNKLHLECDDRNQRIRRLLIVSNTAFTEAQYEPTARAATLEQSRRMRENEVGK